MIYCELYQLPKTIFKKKVSKTYISEFRKGKNREQEAKKRSEE